MRIDQEYVKQQPVGVRHLGDGLAVPAPSIEAIRVKRYLLLGGAQEIAQPYWIEKTDKETGEITKRSEFRVSCCMRAPIDTENGVSFWRNEDHFWYLGFFLMGCMCGYACVLGFRG